MMNKRILSIFSAFFLLFSAVPAMATESVTLTGSISLSSEYPLEGDTVKITAVLTNSGTQDVPDTAVMLLCASQTIETKQTGILTPQQQFTFDTEYALADLPAVLELVVGDTVICTKKVGGAHLAILETAFVQKEDADGKAVFDISGKVKNSGYEAATAGKVSAKKGDTALAEQEIASLGAGEQADFLLTVSIPVSDFTSPQMDISLAVECGEISSAAAITLTNGKIVQDVTVNGGLPLSVMVGSTAQVAVVILPDTAPAGYTAAVADESIAGAVAEGMTITVTALKEGTTKLRVTAGTVTKEIDVTVTPVKKSTDLDGISFYYMNGETKVNIPLNQAFSYYTYTGYQADIVSTISSIGVDITAEDLSDVTVRKLEDDKTTTVGMTSIPLSTKKSKKILIRKGTGDTYTIVVNYLPVIDGLASEFTVYTGYACDTDITDKYYDNEDTSVTVGVVDSEGTQLGSVYTDSDTSHVYWRYTSAADNAGMAASFVFTDRSGGVTTKAVTIISKQDTDAPEWSNSNTPYVSGITTSAASVSWSAATDNDQVKNYVVYYYEKAVDKEDKTVSTGSGNSTSLSGLDSGTKYYVYVEAVDRSGNILKSKTVNFTTRSKSSGTSGSGTSGNISATPAPTATPDASSFSDLDGYDWAKDQITALHQEGVIQGVSESEFAPDHQITRADFITLLVRGMKLEAEVAGNFNDVGEDSYYYQTVGIARALGIVEGAEGGLFMPDENITRQDMMVMTARALQGKLTAESSAGAFADDVSIGSYAKDAIYTLAAAGIIKGDQNGKVLPLDATSRAEAAVMIYRILEAYVPKS